MLDLADQAVRPDLADAVMHEEPGDGGEAVVTEVLRTGYKWKGKVLRAAMVKVRAEAINRREADDGCTARMVREGLLQDPRRHR